MALRARRAMPEGGHVHIETSRVEVQRKGVRQRPGLAAGSYVVLVFGDSDMYRPEHEVKFFQLLGGGQKDGGWQRENMSKNRLAILPGRTHYDIFFSPELISTALTFIEGREQAADWQAASAK